MRSAVTRVSRIVVNRQKACSKTRAKIKVTCCSQGKGLTVTYACDLGKMCHLGLYLLHAVIAPGMALLQQAHACTKFHHCFQHSRRQLNFSAYFTRRRAIQSGVGKHGGVMMASSGNSSPAKAQGRRRRVSDLPSGGHLCGTCSLSSCGASAASAETRECQLCMTTQCPDGCRALATTNTAGSCTTSEPVPYARCRSPHCNRV